ncbi:MAG TPA: ABC transporter permease, partial [Actinomycetota bacterium]|nr:ABC transporter permease [Actinomycetota bacterium]
MSGLALAVRQFKYENKAFWRNPPAAFFTVVFPIMFLVVFNLIFGNEEIRIPGGIVSGSTFYVAAIAALSVISACYVNVSMGISFSRDAGTLKRLRGTPLPAWAYIFGRVAQGVFVAVLLVGVVTLFGALFYDVSVPTKTMP